MRPSNMSALLSLLSFLLVMVVGEGRTLLSAKETTMMVPDSTVDVMAYWKTVHPNSPIPFSLSLGNQKKDLPFLISGSGAKGADEKSSVLKLNPKLDQAKKKFSPYYYDNPADGYDRVYYDGHGDNQMLFNYEAVKLKLETLDMYWYNGAHGINKKPELDLADKKFSRHNNGNPSHGHDHVHLAKMKFSRYIYGNPADDHVRVQYDDHSDNHMVFNSEATKLKKKNSDLYQHSRVTKKPKLNLAKKKFSRYIYDNPTDGPDYVRLATKKFSRYFYGSPAVGHHVHYDGYGDRYMVLNYEAMKIKKKNSDLYQHSGANGIDKKSKLNIAKKKFSRYIYDNLADGHDHVHLAKKKFSHYIYGSSEDGHEHVNRDGHSDNHIVLNKEADKLRTDNSDWYHYSGLNRVDKKHKPDLVNKKFARCIYGNPVNERPFL